MLIQTPRQRSSNAAVFSRRLSMGLSAGVAAVLGLPVVGFSSRH